MSKFGKILIISDVHSKIKEMIDFMQLMIDESEENFDFAIHLGDFWSGRNYSPRHGKQIREEFTDYEYFKKMPIPLFCLKGNEDLTYPQSSWNYANLCVMKNQEIFQLNNWKGFTIDYEYPGEKNDTTPMHPELSTDAGIDIILSHRPPFELLDDTLHMKTHTVLTKTGSPMTRKYYDKIKPALLLFGHFHYSNFLKTDYGLIACLDKLIRIGGRKKSKFKYSYAILDSFDQSLEVFWKNRKFFKYSILEQKMIYSHRLDNRNLYKKRKFRRKRRL